MVRVIVQAWHEVSMLWALMPAQSGQTRGRRWQQADAHACGRRALGEATKRR
jgi:hypothetical protein